MEKGFKHVPEGELLPDKAAKESGKKPKKSPSKGLGALLGAGLALFGSGHGGEASPQEVADAFASEVNPNPAQQDSSQARGSGRGARKEEWFERDEDPPME